MRKYRRGNKSKYDFISMKDIDKKLHGADDKEYHIRLLQIVDNKLDSLMYSLERSRIREYMILTDSRRRLFAVNFISGLGKGFGQAIGFTVLTAMAVYLVSKWVNIPIIGEYIAEFLDIIDKYRRNY